MNVRDVPKSREEAHAITAKRKAKEVVAFFYEQVISMGIHPGNIVFINKRLDNIYNDQLLLDKICQEIKNILESNGWQDVEVKYEEIWEASR